MSFFILAASTVLQFAAAAVAFANIRASGRRLAWILIASALILMGVRRLITLWTALAAPAAYTPNLAAEFTALLVSSLLLAAVVGMLSIFGDFRRASASAAAERQRFQDFAEATSDWFWETDADHCYTWFSERVEDFIDFPRDWHYGKSRIELGQPDQPDPAWDAHLAQLAAHEPFRDVEFYRVAPDGARWIRSSGTPVFDADGTFRGYRGTGTDITKFKVAERSFEAARAQLGKAIGSMSEGLAIFDAEDHLILCNEHLRRHNPWFADRIVPGAKYADLIDLFTRNALPLDMSEAERAVWREERLSLRSRPGATMEFQVRDGSWCRISEYRTEDGGTVTLRTDVSELKRRQLELDDQRQQAEAASQSKSAFLANMSHELRTPLNAIIGFAEIIKDRALGPNDAKYPEYAADIHDSGMHLLSLINDILDLSKIESNKDELQEEDLDIAATVIAAARLVEPKAIAAGVTLTYELGADGPRLRADERKLKQIIVNLLTNAVKFCDPGGMVTVKAWCRPDSGYVLQVRDDGIGMAPEDIPKAMSLFGQVDNGLDRKYEGTGLGLPLAKALTEQHGGILDLQSQPGAGTTATVRLPVARLVRQDSAVRERAAVS